MSLSKITTPPVLAGFLLALISTSVIAQDQREDHANFDQTNRFSRYDPQDRSDDGSRNDARFQDERRWSGEALDQPYDDRNRDRSQNRDRFQIDDRQMQNDQPAGLGVTISEDGNRRVRVDRVFQGSPADEAGLRDNDEILRVGGQRIDSPQQLTSVIRRMDPNAQVRIEINRDGEPRTLVARLESRREALSPRYDQGQSSDSRRSIDAPSGYDDLIVYVDNLQNQVDRMKRELTELRSMIEDDPSNRNWSSQPNSSGDRSDQNQPQQSREQNRSNNR